MITLTPLESSKKQLEAVLAGLEKLPARMAAQAFGIAFEHFSSGVEDIFQEEGNPRWEGLADSTAEEREAFGYGPWHPILQRERYLLRSLTEDMAPQTVYEYKASVGGYGTEAHRSGNFTESNVSGADYSWRFATLDDRFLALQLGDDRLPSRPMIPRGDQAIQIGQRISADLRALVERLMVH